MSYRTIPPSICRRYPISLAQKRLWRFQHANPNNSLYHLPFGWRLKGRLDLGSLRMAFTFVAGRHEALRTSFKSLADGLIIQEIADPSACDLPVVDISRFRHEH